MVTAGCAWFESGSKPALALAERPSVAVLPFGIEVEIKRLSSVKSVTEELSAEQEARLVSSAVREIREEARRLFYSRVQAGERFRLISLEETDAVIAGLGLEPGGAIEPEQVTVLRNQLGADLVVTGNVLDYGKVRWQWAAAGMLGDLSWETMALGLATAWNPIAILANVGFELLTGTPIWFGGGYLFGVAFRPVRVEAWAVDVANGEVVWSKMEVAIYTWKGMNDVPEPERAKKEVQLAHNLKKAMEALGESFLDAGLTKATLWERRLPARDVVAF